MDLSKILHTLGEQLLSPIPMCFALGIFCKLVHGGIKIPKDLYYAISIYLLMSIGFIGGHELAKEYAEHGISTIWMPALATLFLGCLTPITSYVVLRKLGGMSIADSAGIAAHYGSTSAVTYAVADAFANQAGSTPNGFLPTLVTILECPGIAIALAMGVVFSQMQRAHEKAELADYSSEPNGTNGHNGNGNGNGEHGGGRFWEALHEVVTGQSLMLMAGLLVIGFVSTQFVPGATTVDPHTHKPTGSFAPFFDFFYSKNMIFRGALCIFLLEMGLVAGERLADLLKVGPFLIAFGVLMPLFHGFLGAWFGSLAGLNAGGCTVFAAIVSSASYIAAPPAVRLTLPEANPTYSITAALAITFPFNIAFGIPIYYHMARMVGASTY